MYSSIFTIFFSKLKDFASLNTKEVAESLIAGLQVLEVVLPQIHPELRPQVKYCSVH
jgi:hypothetical protein